MPSSSHDQRQASAILHALAKATQDSNALPTEHKWYSSYPVYFEVDTWPAIARELIRQEYGLPALQKLAEIPMIDLDAPNSVSDETVVLLDKLIAELVEQTTAATLLPYWDLMCAIAARQWELEKLAQGVDAEPWAYASVMDAMWATACKTSPDQATQGIKLINRGVTLKESIGFQDINKEMIELLEDAQKLHIPIPFDEQTCKKILTASY